MANTNSTRETLLTEHEVARLLNVSVGTIRRRRLLRQPPEWRKIGANVCYEPSAVRRVIEGAKRVAVEG